jgi:type IV pilus assembly protein PilE
MGMARRGFTMTELMVTVAIIGVLAGIAIPSWQESQWRSKRAEVPANVNSIRAAELAYYATWSTFVEETNTLPDGLHLNEDDVKLRQWVSLGSGGGFDTIGWKPYGEVRGSYTIPVGDETALQVEGACNVDGDSEAATYYATEEASGVWDDDTVF